jgi:pyruvate/2-oxoglutarate dehydrogenase complex dihydrolipoamide acyltransferase (E2) component
MPSVNMPKLSDSMTEGTVARWLKANGERVQRGDDLVEIETDKLTMAYEADYTGIVRILVAEGVTVPVGTPIAEVQDDRDMGEVSASSRAGEHAEPSASVRQHARPGEDDVAPSASGITHRHELGVSRTGGPPPDRLLRHVRDVSATGRHGGILQMRPWFRLRDRGAPCSSAETEACRTAKARRHYGQTYSHWLRRGRPISNGGRRAGSSRNDHQRHR